MAGQYFDSESGLFYNINRSYSPAIGRYISSDPIGIAGGLNTFLYANASPVNYLDVEGLCDPKNLQRCQLLLQKMLYKAQKMADKMASYNPWLDALSGWPYRIMGVIYYTKRYTHYYAILDLQRGILNNYREYIRLGCDKDDGGPGTGAVPGDVLDKATIPIFPPPGLELPNVQAPNPSTVAPFFLLPIILIPLLL